MARKTREAPPWEALPDEEYRRVAGALVHFSGKSVNSNAAQMGVRLGQEAAWRASYVSVRTLMAHGRTLALDYTANSGKTATAVKHFRLVREGDASVPAEIRQQLAALHAELTQGHYEHGTRTVSVRQRQLLLPRDDGSYVAVSPLSAGGVSLALRQQVEAHNEAVKALPRKADGRPPIRRIEQAILGLGGANPQNVGALVRDMQRPLLCRPPTVERGVREAYALHYQGVSLELPRQATEALIDWIARQKGRARTGAPATDDGDQQATVGSSLHAREREERLVEDIAAALLARGRYAHGVLQAHQNDLPGGALLAQNVSELVRGLIDPSQREAGWARRFGLEVARLLVAYEGKAPVPGKPPRVLKLRYGQDEILAIAALIEEYVR